MHCAGGESHPWEGGPPMQERLRPRNTKSKQEKKTHCPGEQVVNWVVKREAEELNSYGPAATPRLLVDDVGCAGLTAREDFLILCVQQAAFTV